jgi:hypothetical protein
MAGQLSRRLPGRSEACRLLKQGSADWLAPPTPYLAEVSTRDKNGDKACTGLDFESAKKAPLPKLTGPLAGNHRANMASRTAIRDGFQERIVAGSQRHNILYLPTLWRKKYQEKILGYRDRPGSFRGRSWGKWQEFWIAL